MKPKAIDCFMLMNTALSLRNGRRLPEMGRPLIQEVFTTFVNISLTITSLDIIDPKNMELQIGGIINQRWVDPRLNADEQTRKLAVAGQIWRPKIVPTNAHTVSCQNGENTMFWRGYGEGNILLSEKFEVVVSCSNNLQKFPFDDQECVLKFGTYRFPMEEVVLKWDNPLVELQTSTNLQQFQLVNVTTYEEIEVRQSGNFTIAAVNFTIQRHSKHYVYCMILPSSLFSTLSYIAMLLDFSRYYSKYTLNLSSIVFLMILYYLSLCSNIPIPYFKALDKYVIFCLIFSIISAIYTFMLDLLRKAKEEVAAKNRGWRRKCRKVLQIVERGITIAYPIVFLTFLFAFSFYYMR